MSAATVLYDAPGPATRRRHQIYSLVFALVAIAVLAWVYIKLKDAGEFEQRIFDGLSQSNVWEAIWEGVQATLKAAGLAIVLAVIVGLLLAVGRLSDHPWIRVPCRLVVEFFRAVPVLLLIIFSFGLLAGRGLETDIRGLIAVVAGLTLYNGAVLAEVFRAGVQAVPRGQSEAAYAIGMRKSQVMSIVLLPQAIRYMLPAIISQCVVALKDTSLGFVAAYVELYAEGRQIALFLHNQLMVWGLIALIYIVMNNIVSEIATLLEKRLARGRRGASAAMAEVEDVLPVG
jgi:glutamate transport system permease protein